MAATSPAWRKWSNPWPGPPSPARARPSTGSCPVSPGNRRAEGRGLRAERPYPRTGCCFTGGQSGRAVEEEAVPVPERSALSPRPSAFPKNDRGGSDVVVFRLFLDDIVRVQLHFQGVVPGRQAGHVHELIGQGAH